MRERERKMQRVNATGATLCHKANYIKLFHRILAQKCFPDFDLPFNQKRLKELSILFSKTKPHKTAQLENFLFFSIPLWYYMFV
jgi:hypothetical protein